MNVSRSLLAALGALVLAATIALPATADQSRNLDWSGDLTAGSSLAVAVVNGSIVADGVSGSHATLQAHATSKSADLATVKLKVAKRTNGIAICFDTPDQHYSDDCSNSHSSGMHWGDDGIRIDVTVHVPAGVDLAAHTVNGKISIRGVTGNTEAKTVNGAISIATAGRAQAKTVNGAIDAHIGAAWSGELDYKTVNGSIAVSLPRSAAFSVHAKTLNGSIHAAAFNLKEASHHFVGHSLDGTVGSGGRSLNLKTVNGSISLEAS